MDQEGDVFQVSFGEDRPVEMWIRVEMALVELWWLPLAHCILLVQLEEILSLELADDDALGGRVL